MRAALLRWLGAAEVGHLARVQLRVQEQGSVLTAMAFARAAATAPEGEYSLQRHREAEAHESTVCRLYMSDATERLPQLRLAAPRGEQRARAALLLFLVAVGLGVNALASTIRGRESCSDTGCPAGQVCYGGRCKPLQVPKPQEPLPLPVAPICGTLLPGRMP